MINLFGWVVSKRLTKGLGAIFLGLTLISCADTDGPPADLLGTTTGLVTTGTVYVVDAAGVELSKPINIDSTFRFDVRESTAPFILKTVSDTVGAPVLYSYAAEASSDFNVAVNITPLTSLAVYIANGNTDPAALYNTWVSSFGTITAAAITDAQATVNANLATQYRAFSLDPKTYDFIKTRFLVNDTGVDALLNELTVDTSAGIEISVAGIAGALSYNSAIDITGFDIGGVAEAVAGDYTLVQNVAIDAGAVSANVLLSINLPVSEVPTVPTANVQIVEDMFRSFYGSEGNIVINSITATEDVTIATTIITEIDATITTLDGDVAYVATYTYTLNPL